MFKTPTFEQIRDTILRDTKSIWPSADVSEDSDHFVHASRLASCAMGQYAHQHWIARQIFPDTAESDYLERHAAMRGLRRRNPTTASGTLTVSGIAQSMLSDGLQVRIGQRFTALPPAPLSAAAARRKYRQSPTSRARLPMCATARRN